VNESLDGASAVLPRLPAGSARGPLLRTRVPTLPWTAIRAELWIVAVAELALLITVVLRELSVSVQTLAGHALIATATGLIAALASFVFAERARGSRERCDLLMSVAFGILSVTGLLLAGAPAFLSARPGQSWQWATLALQLAAGAILVGSSLVLTHRSTPERRGLDRSVMAGVIVLLVARIDYFLLPSAGNGSLYGGDLLMLGASLVILYGCIVEFRASQRRLMADAAMLERRRMARDMHDGLAQELAFIATYSQRLGRTGDDATTVVHLRAAAERALHDSRTAIAVLTSTDDAPLDRLITRTVDSFRSRFPVDVELDLEQDVVVDAERRNALLRILNEAMINATRHGSARQILVRLTGGQRGSALSISDDGSGFDVPAAVSAGRGLGLISMNERAELLGGGLNIISAPGTGTVVEVGLP
jgi:signal transduction histidine kinase